MQYKVFGCRVNKYYTGLWKQYFEQKNISDWLLVSTCMVTDQAKSRRIKYILQEIKNHKIIYIVGCGSIQRWQVIKDSNFYKLYPELKQFAKQIELLPEKPEEEMENITNVDTEKEKKVKIWDFSYKNKNSFTTKNFLLIQTGCDNFCSFCMTVIARSKHRNIELDDILGQINSFVNGWWKEIVLTGVNLWARGSDDTNDIDHSRLDYLLNQIVQKTTIQRIRISSLWPEFVSDNVLDVICNDRFLPYLHLSIQHFDDEILMNMRRHYDLAHIQNTITKIRNLNKKNIEILNLWADIITGFPGETEEKFELLKTYVKKFNISQLHTFPFSPHSKWITVPASKLPDQIPESIRRLRNKELHNIWIEQKVILQQKTVWREVKVLLEKVKDNVCYGRSENYLPVRISGNYKKNDVINVNYSLILV